MIKEQIRDFIQDNWVAKFMALVISLFLWTTVMGRRDFVLTKLVNLEILTSMIRWFWLRRLIESESAFPVPDPH